MAEYAFIQNSRIGRSIFQIASDQIEVSWFGSAQGQKKLPLRKISPDYDRGRRRFHTLYVFPGVIALAGLGGVVFLMTQGRISFENVTYPELLQIGGMTGAMMAGIVGIIPGIPRVEYFQFYDHWRRPLFYIVREPSQGEECDDFVRALLDQIERAQKGEPVPATNMPPPMNSVRVLNADDSYFFGEIRWQLAILMGGISTGLPLVPRLDEALGGLLFFMIFGCCVGGITFAWFSYQGKERHRHFALIGAALSLVAPLFY